MSKPIDIYCNNEISKDNPNFYLTRYIYELEIITKTKQKKTFNNVTREKYCKIVNFDDNINFCDINEFFLKVTRMHVFKDVFTIRKNFNINNNEYECIYKTPDLYLEFNKNHLNLVNCCCYLKAEDNSELGMRLFITPPNY